MKGGGVTEEKGGGGGGGGLYAEGEMTMVTAKLGVGGSENVPGGGSGVPVTSETGGILVQGAEGGEHTVRRRCRWLNTSA